MDDSPPTARSVAAAGSEPSRPVPLAAPRIYYLPLTGRADALGPALDAIAGLGFDTLLLPPVLDPGPAGDPFLLADPDRLDARLGLPGAAADGIAEVAAMAETHGLHLMLDLVSDRIAAGGALARRLGLPDPAERLPDPRRRPEDRHAADAIAAGTAWHAVLGAVVRTAAEAGVAGLRCLAPERLGADVWRDLIAAAPDCRFIASIEDTAADALAGLGAAGFAAAFLPLPFPGGEAVARLEAARRTFPAVILGPEAPYGARLAYLAGADGDRGPAARRALDVAAALGDGLLVVAGFQSGATRPLHPVRTEPIAPAGEEAGGLGAAILAANRLLATADRPGGAIRALTAPDARVLALLKTDSFDPRSANAARLVLVNADLHRSEAIEASAVLAEAGGRFAAFREIGAGAGELLGPGRSVRLDPAGVRTFASEAADPILVPSPDVEDGMAAPRMAIEAIAPAVDDGRFPVKRIVGETLRVEADAFTDGHDRIAVALLWRPLDEPDWREIRMVPLGNDRWAADMPLARLGRHEFTVEAWRDDFASYRSEIEKKHAARLDLRLEIEEGRRMVETYAAGAPAHVAAELAHLGDRLAGAASDAERVALFLAEDTAALMRQADPRAFRLRHEPPLPIDAERTGATFASWYELFPRSMSYDANRHGTFDDVIRELPRIRDMGFDVLYFPPIHPIGRRNRKGRNNSLKAGENDPGSPYAIGSEAGGHDALHPALGTLADFRRLVAEAGRHGLEIALDFAIQCSPDHPWLKEHPDWFDYRPDGSIKYAENPPKKYEDIVNVDFYADGARPALWLALRDAVETWVKEGVRLFRVDNPHTKPFPFWEWMIGDIRSRWPGVLFLAEAFTRPKVMYRLAKLGFSQSYTYFTWRNTKHELADYLTELTAEAELGGNAPRDFFRPHFFVNTPDINPEFLQNAPRSAYLIRAALATTLSGLWGMYNGFEICEGRPVPGKEEYLDSEKYEIRVWDWDRPGNIRAEIARLNRIRRENPALHSHLGIRFYEATNDKVLLYRKATAKLDNVLVVAVSLDPHSRQGARIELPLWEFGLPDHGRLAVEDLMRGYTFDWYGRYQDIMLDPNELPFSIWRVRPVE